MIAELIHMINFASFVESGCHHRDKGRDDDIRRPNMSLSGAKLIVH